MNQKTSSKTKHQSTNEMVPMTLVPPVKRKEFLRDALNKKKCPILLVDDDPDVLTVAKLFLEKDGYNNLYLVDDSRFVIPLLKEKEVSLIILDLIMPHIMGSELLPKLQKDFSHIPIIIMTGSENLNDAINCMNLEAFDYLIKPVSQSRLLLTVDKALKIHLLQRELSTLKDCLFTDPLKSLNTFSRIITCSNKMRAVFQYAEYVSKSSQPILITGESGVGKELIALAIYELSEVKGRFICVNVAGLDDLMFTDTLFGHKKGAFTGADHDREGLICKANGGTLFLDEIGDLSYQSQIKLLRYLQEQKYYPMGSDTLLDSDARIIVSTNKDLQSMASRGDFRKDLYYRLCTHQLHIPPLRDRIEDIPLLLDHFIKEAAESLGKQKPVPAPELLTLLPKFTFPGNVREFKAMVTDAVTRHESGLLTLQHFQAFNGNNNVKPLPSRRCELITEIFDKFPTLREIEEYMVGKAMEISSGNKSAAASLLGITRQALNKRNRSQRKLTDPHS